MERICQSLILFQYPKDDQETLIVRDTICSQHRKIISALRTVAKNNNWADSVVGDIDRLIPR